MYYMNSAENQGFLVWFLALNVLICYTWRSYWDISWMLNHRKTQNCSKLSKFSIISPNFKIRGLFSVYGVGPVFWVWTGLLRALTAEKTSPASTSTSPSSCKLTTSVCAIRVYRLRERWSSLVCLCHGSVYCASMPACQHARSVPACQRVIPEVSELPWTVSQKS